GRAEAERTAFVPLVFEARLLEAKLAPDAERASLLQGLERDARTAGLMRVARLAGASARRPAR
ncbi:MAG TPA: hypothetical protein VLT33_05755, partial [Labilithrix sp.]|nr:hypothetical protein [Labilithrix sp.]